MTFVKFLSGEGTHTLPAHLFHHILRMAHMHLCWTCRCSHYRRSKYKRASRRRSPKPLL